MTYSIGDTANSTLGQPGTMTPRPAEPPSLPIAPGIPPSYLKRLLTAVTVIAAALAVVLVLWFQIHTLLLGFAGVLVAVPLVTVSDWLARRSGLRRWIALALVVLATLAVLGALVWLAEARVSSQVDALRQQVPQSWAQLQQHLRQHAWGRWLVPQLRSHIENTSPLVGGAHAILWYGGEVFVVIFVGLFSAIDPDLYVAGFLRLIPSNHARQRARRVLTDLRLALWWWLVGQFVAMLFIGAVTALVVWALGVELALTLGILAAFLNFIPNFGPLLAVVPAALLALLHGPLVALWVVLAYGAIQLFQNHVVTPLVQQEVAQLPPVILMLSQIFMYYWDGALGMILAPPLALLVIKLVQTLYLHDPSPRSAGPVDPP